MQALCGFLCNVDMADIPHERMLELQAALGRAGPSRSVDATVIAALPPLLDLSVNSGANGRSVISQEPYSI